MTVIDQVLRRLVAAELIFNEEFRRRRVSHIFVDNHHAVLVPVDRRSEAPIIFVIGDEDEAVNETGSQAIEAAKLSFDEIS